MLSRLLETNVTFSNNSFSLRCGKCADIHTAQLDGKTAKSCECDCHSKPYCPPYNIPYHDPCCPIIPSPIWCGTNAPNNCIPNETTCHLDFNQYILQENNVL